MDANKNFPGLTTARSSSMVPLSREKTDRLRQYVNGVERLPDGEMVANGGLVPTSDELTEYRLRLAAIDREMRAPLDALKRLITRKFLGFPGAKDEILPEIVAAYCLELADVPLWAVEAAFHEVKLAGATFRPSAAELHKLARAGCAWLLDEREKLSMVAQVHSKSAETNEAKPSPEERARVKAGWLKLRDELSAPAMQSSGAR